MDQSKAPSGLDSLVLAAGSKVDKDEPDMKKTSAGQRTNNGTGGKISPAASPPADDGANDTENGSKNSANHESGEDQRIRKKNLNRFPEKLMKILDSEEYINIFSWSPSGKSFIIHKPYELVSVVLTKHFDAKEDMKFDSFLRKLYRWGFSKKTVYEDEGDEEGAHIYFHCNFQKGNFLLCANVTCTSKPATSRPSAQKGGRSGFYGITPQQMMLSRGVVFGNDNPQRGHAPAVGGDIFGYSQLQNFGGSFPPSSFRHDSEEELRINRRFRERELSLLQWQQQQQQQQQQLQLYNNASSRGVAMGPVAVIRQQPHGVGLPALQNAAGSEQHLSVQSLNNMLNPGSTVKVARLGQDVNHFEQQNIIRLQQQDQMLTSSNDPRFLVDQSRRIDYETPMRYESQQPSVGRFLTPQLLGAGNQASRLEHQQQQQAAMLLNHGLVGASRNHSRVLASNSSFLPSYQYQGPTQSAISSGQAPPFFGNGNLDTPTPQKRMMGLLDEPSSKRKRDHASISNTKQQQSSSQPDSDSQIIRSPKR